MKKTQEQLILMLQKLDNLEIAVKIDMTNDASWNVLCCLCANRQKYEKWHDIKINLNMVKCEMVVALVHHCYFIANVFYCED